ncbi:MAG: hypothetical protein EOP93_11870 [Lysobacteraceae bacterium]|nr:MAG: hypothetical protein EOP93_11870 [Xanthomonadaceae bacterium]
MSKSRRLSSASASSSAASCRLEWRPSQRVGAMLWALAALAPFSLVASDLPRAWAWPLAALACGHGVLAARRHARQAKRTLVIPPGRGAATCNSDRMHGLRVAWRGPLAFLQWRDRSGAKRRLSFWPDTLPAGMRRELRIAAIRRDPASEPPSMAG